MIAGKVEAIAVESFGHLAREADAFARGQALRASLAAAEVAFRLSVGLDLGQVGALDGEQRNRLALRLERLIERERLRGASGHWAYDINRHIGLKHARDLLGRTPQPRRDAAPCPRPRRPRPAARSASPTLKVLAGALRART